MVNYVELPAGYDFTEKFPTWIISFSPDLASWLVTNERFFYYEYDKEFETEEEGIKFFKENAKLFYDIEMKMKMKVYRPSSYEGGVWLENLKELVKF